MTRPITTLTASDVKARCRELDADLVGIASCEVLNANPPDPKVPQTPARISERFRSCVVLAKRMPLGQYLSPNRWAGAYANQVVLRYLAHLAYRTAAWLEQEGWPSLVVPHDEVSPELKRGSYGYLSMRHLAVEAGLGTFGLEANLLTPEYGPRVYLAAVLTEAPLEADRPITEQLCIGEPCGRCLLACPTDAVHQWTLDKRRCAEAAELHGVPSILEGPIHRLIFGEAWGGVLADPDTRAKWASMVRMVEAFGVCPRCIEVCPIGTDFHRHLARAHRLIPESTAAKKQRLKEMRSAQRAGHYVDGNPPVDVRFIGPDGFRPRRGQPAGLEKER